MDVAFVEWRFRADLWLASTVVAVFAAYVALDLARGVSSRHRFTALRATLASALALGAGTWAAHFIAMAGEPLPFATGYDSALASAALAVALATSMVGVHMSARPALGRGRVAVAAVVLGAGACAVPMVGLVALRLAPAAHWDWPLLAGSWVASALSAGGALAIVALQRRRFTQLAVAWQACVALGLGGAIALGNAGVLHAALLPPGIASLAAGQTSPGTLSALASLGVPALLAVLLMTSVLEARFRRLLQRTRDEVKRVAQTDRLTELPNRSMIEEALQVAAIRADRQKHRLALLLLNVDGLKAINESFGQATGDAMLREVAQRLRRLAGAGDLIARAGGDEFLLMLDANPTQQDAAHVATRLLAAMNEPCHVDEHEISMSCTVGVAMYPAHGSAAKLIAHAAAAMRHAKRTGGASHAFFEERMVAGSREQVELLQDLRRAIAQRELELYYQPKIHAPSGQITGAEALMRWKHPQRGMVGPNVFIPLAERYGLINALGNWLIDEVCRQIHAWREKGLRMRVAINLSVHQLRQPDLVERIANALARHHIDPSLLTCEITESAAMDDTRITLQVIERLSAIGVHLSIDDFGTGYSSLSYLRQLAAEELKIDRSFVFDLESSPDARAIVDAVVKLAQALGLKVVAEGVETEQQQEILRQLGCNELQGYLFAKPMPADALVLWAMNDEGPRALDFRPSLFGDTLPQSV
ncbi:MAG: EAL domain-containing protein [Rhizobacter sp.]|nr:EAL domain-containing protein [Rhizobacter sp.]